MDAPLNVPEHAQRLLLNLITKSHEDYIDPLTSIDWSKGIDKTRYPKRKDGCWLYGTEYWDRLSEEQKHEMAWKEIAREASNFIWLEETIPLIFMTAVNQLGTAIPPAVREYMMIFSREELSHILMFRKYLKLADLELFKPSDGLHAFCVNDLPKMPPIMGTLCTLLVEHIAESGAVYLVSNDEVDPLTREIFLRHHQEEARHLSFGKWTTQAYLESASPEEKAKLKGVVENLLGKLILKYTYNPEIANHVSFDFGIAADDAATAEKVRRSAVNDKHNDDRFHSLLLWLKKAGLLGENYNWRSATVEY